MIFKTISLNYKGKVFLNCSSGDQKSALAADSAFGSMLRSSYQTDFSEAQGIFTNLNGNLESIISGGPSQQGMSPAELAARNSQALSNAAASNKNIQAAIGEARDTGGATPGVESGVTQAVRGDYMAKVENNLSNQEADITNKNYELGRENYKMAVQADMALPAATMNPVTAAAGVANEANKITGDQASEIQKSKTSWMGLAGGLASSVSQGIAASQSG